METSCPVTYIYTLKDPRDDEVYYVGKADHPRHRLRSHLSHSDGSIDSAKMRWIFMLQQLGLRPSLRVIACVPKKFFPDHEKLWIKFYHDLNPRLLNREVHGYFTHRRTKPMETITFVVRYFMIETIFKRSLGIFR